MPLEEIEATVNVGLLLVATDMLNVAVELQSYINNCVGTTKYMEKKYRQSVFTVDKIKHSVAELLELLDNPPAHGTEMIQVRLNQLPYPDRIYRDLKRNNSITIIQEILDLTEKHQIPDQANIARRLQTSLGFLKETIFPDFT